MEAAAFLKGNAVELNPNVPISLAILRDAQKRHVPSIEEISKFLYELTQAGITMHELYLKRVPGGFYSESADTFVGHAAQAGQATLLKRGRFQFSNKWLRLCVDIVLEELSSNPDRMKTLLVAAKYDAFDLLATIAGIATRVPDETPI